MYHAEIMTDNTYHKFCFIFGSFATTAPNLRSPESDIDVVSKNMDECEVRSLLQKKYPILSPKTKIDMISATLKQNEIQHVQCYWQNIKPIKLYSHGNTEYTFEEGERNFVCCARDPQKQSMIDYLKSPLIDLTKRKNVIHVINKHYGTQNFADVLADSPTEETQIIKELHESKWILSGECEKIFKKKLVIDTGHKNVVGSDFGMPYNSFLSKCIKKS